MVPVGVVIQRIISLRTGVDRVSQLEATRYFVRQFCNTNVGCRKVSGFLVLWAEGLMDLWHHFGPPSAVRH